MQVLESQNFTIPIESPETIVPSLRKSSVNSVNPWSVRTVYPNTQTDQTRVLSARVLSVVSLFVTLPVAKSHFRTLLSAQPVTSHPSVQPTSCSSSEPSSDSVVASEEGRLPLSGGTGGPHAILRRRVFTFPSLRRWERPSFSVDNNWIEPSSHPRARIVDLGFAERDQIAPPLEFIVLFVRSVNTSWFRGVYAKGAYPDTALR